MVLVTGGTGLVGSHLLYHLARENMSIIAIHRKSSDLTIVKRVFHYYTSDPRALLARITWIQADLTDIPSLKEVFTYTFKYVYHCAAMISFNDKDYYRLRNINIKGTANLVNLSLQHKVNKFCFVSSIATIDEYPGKEFITEENEWNPELKHHGYAITKYGAEMEVWRASQEGLDIIIVNPGVILGSGLWNSGSGKLFSSLANGFSYYTNGVTGFVDVKDVVETMIALMKSKTKNERFVLVAENKSFKEVLFQIASGLGVKRPSIKVNRIISEVAWRFDWIQGLFSGDRKLTKHTARSGHHRSYYSAAKVQKYLGFNFRPIHQTILDVCKVYIKENSIS